MRILVTAGNTQVPIDKVRCITNIFTGRTGARIALHAHEGGHSVTLLTSYPEVIPALAPGRRFDSEHWRIEPYATFDDLRGLMERKVREGGFEAIIHCAAVSDYQFAGIYAPEPGTQFRSEDGHWVGTGNAAPALADRGAGKVKSDEPELWVRLVRAPKLVDFIRDDWQFRGVLVKFKLEVGVSDEQLLEIAERSRRHSNADLMVANTLEGADSWAFLGPLAGRYERLTRAKMPARLLQAVTQLHEERSHG